MRTHRPFILALAAVLLTAARPAAAQPPLTSARTLAVYRLATRAGAGLPAEVSVADSAGTLVAHYRFPAARAAAPMLVTVIDTDLVLQSETPAGVLTLVLYQRNDDGFVTDAVGQWSLGGRHGTLRRSDRADR